MRQRDARSRSRRGLKNFRRHRPALRCVNHRLAVWSKLHIVHRRPRNNAARAASGNRNHPDAGAPAIFLGKHQPLRIRQPRHASHPPVQVFRQIRRLTGCSVQHHQAPAVALIARSHLRPKREQFSVRRIQRRIIGAQSHRDFSNLAAGDGNRVDIGVGAGRGIGIDVHGEGDLQRIRGNRVIVGPSQRKRRHIVRPGSQILRIRSIRVDHQQMLPPLRLIGRPMPIKQRCVDPRFDFVFCVGLDLILITPVVRAALRINAGLEHQLLPIGRNQQPACLRRQAGNLARIPAIGVHYPDLRRSATVGNEVNLPGIGRPPRTLVIVPLVRQLHGRPAV